MSTVRQYVQDYINDLQQLLDATQDDAAFIKAVKDKWKQKDDLRRSFVLASKDEMQPRLGDHGRENNDC